MFPYYEKYKIVRLNRTFLCIEGLILQVNLSIVLDVSALKREAPNIQTVDLDEKTKTQTIKPNKQNC